MVEHLKKSYRVSGGDLGSLPGRILYVREDKDSECVLAKVMLPDGKAKVLRFGKIDGGLLRRELGQCGSKDLESRILVSEHDGIVGIATPIEHSSLDCRHHVEPKDITGNGCPNWHVYNDIIVPVRYKTLEPKAEPVVACGTFWSDYMKKFNKKRLNPRDFESAGIIIREALKVKGTSTNGYGTLHRYNGLELRLVHNLVVQLGNEGQYVNRRQKSKERLSQLPYSRI
jgi:hypothetical protein